MAVLEPLKMVVALTSLRQSTAVMLWWLLVGHCLCDYPLQGDFLAKAKNKFAGVDGIPWSIAMLAHGLIHGGAVALVTGRIELGVAETVVHMTIDYQKCAGRIGMVQDQTLHVLCKVLWVVLVFGWRW